jgi:hypothetical protein
MPVSTRQRPSTGSSHQDSITNIHAAQGCSSCLPAPRCAQFNFMIKYESRLEFVPCTCTARFQPTHTTCYSTASATQQGRNVLQPWVRLAREGCNTSPTHGAYTLLGGVEGGGPFGLWSRGGSVVGPLGPSRTVQP